MADQSARHALPFLMAGQAQKEITHNEAIALIDAIVHPVAEAAGVNTPPISPAIGQCWIVGSAPAGAWATHAQHLACWSEGGWRFAIPVVAMTVWLSDQEIWARWDGAAWRAGEWPVASVIVGGQQVLASRRPAIADPSGGATPDAQGRSAIMAILAALRAHGLIDS